MHAKLAAHKTLLNNDNNTLNSTKTMWLCSCKLLSKGWGVLDTIEVPKSCQHLKLVPSVQIEGCFIVVDDMKVHSAAQLALCILYDLLDELTSHTKVPVLFCHAKRQNIDDVLLI